MGMMPARGYRVAAAAVAAGFASMTAQFLLARELMIVALGEELNVGLVFFAWLLLVGIGSAAGGAAVRRWRPGGDAAGLLLIALGLLVPLSVIWARVQGVLFGFAHGEVIPPEYVLLMSLAALAPVCFATGFLFPILCGMGEGDGAGTGVSGRVYSWDTIGGAAGGAASSLLLIVTAGALGTALAAAAVACFTGAVLMTRPFGRWAWFVLVVAFASSPVWLGAAGVASRTVAWGQPVRESAESGYGNIIVLKNKNQYSFYANGRLAGEVPDTVFGEYLADTAMLAAPGPKRVLLIGAGPVEVAEVLKHGPKEVVWAELDARLIELKKKYTAGPDARVYSDPRVRIVAGDPRRYLTHKGGHFDVVIVDAGAPETVALNRYFTIEFFRLLLGGLTPDGVAAITVPFTENYMGDPEGSMFAGIYAAAYAAMNEQGRAERSGARFPRLIPGPKALLLFGNGDGWEAVDGITAASRFAERGVVSKRYGAALASYYFDPARADAVFSVFAKDPAEYYADPNRRKNAAKEIVLESKKAINRDFIPAAVINHIKYSGTYYKKSLVAGLIERYFRGGRGVGDSFDHTKRQWFLLAGMAIFSMAVMFCGMKLTIVRNFGIYLAAAATGAAGMAAEIILIFVFQVKFGVVYQYLGAINAAFLAGAAAGAAFAFVVLRKGKLLAVTVFRLAAIALTTIICLMVAYLKNAGAGESMLLIFIFAAATGVCIGAVYPCLVRIMAGAAGREASLSGRVYFADMAGACAGALLTSTFFIPVFGITTTLFWLVVIVACSMPLAGR